MTFKETFEMKKLFLMMVLSVPMAWAGASAAAEATPKPDCAAKQKEYDDAKMAAKPGKPDLTSCADKKGKDKADCEKPLKDKAKEDAKAAQEKAKAAKKELDCCKNPKMKGCPA